MSNCCRYENESTSKKGFGKGQCHNSALDKKATQAYAQRSAKVAKLEKANKKLKKSTRKCRSEYNSNSDGSNSC
jgi:hypothetical protein